MSEREFEEYLARLSERLGRKVSRAEVTGELRDHLEDHFAELSAAGVEREEAVRLALDELGDAGLLAQSLMSASRWRSRRLTARWSGATAVIVASALIVLWAMWPQQARIRLAPPVIAQAERPAEGKPARPAATEERIEVALQKPTSVEFLETPLNDAVSFLADSTGVAITMDRRSLEDSGIGVDVGVTLRASNLRLESVLDHLTSKVGLTWTYRDESLEITMPDAEKSQVVTRVYPLGDLLSSGETVSAKILQARGTEFIRILQSSLAPSEWDSEGGSGTAVVNERSLIVTQSWRMQRKVRQFVEQLRRAPTAVDGAKSAAANSLPIPGEAENRIAKALQASADVDFVDTPLVEIVAFLADRYQIHVALDVRALDEVGIAADQPVTIASKGVTLRSILNRLTRQAQLTWTVAHESIVITTPDALEREYLKTRIYPVRDLLSAGDQEDRDELVERLVELIKANLGRTTSGWSDGGGPGAALAVPWRSAIVIVHADAVHQEVEQLLADLRQSHGKELAGEAPNGRAVVLQVYRVQPPSPENSPPMEMATLEELVKTLVEPESWAQEPQAYVRHVGDRLVVRHTTACQRKIARFLTVELGLDLLPVQRGAGPTTFPGGGFF